MLPCYVLHYFALPVAALLILRYIYRMLRYVYSPGEWEDRPSEFIAKSTAPWLALAGIVFVAAIIQGIRDHAPPFPVRVRVDAQRR